MLNGGALGINHNDLARRSRAKARHYPLIRADIPLLYDGDELVAEYDGANALQKRYVHGPGIDEPIFSMQNGRKLK